MNLNFLKTFPAAALAASLSGCNDFPLSADELSTGSNEPEELVACFTMDPAGSEVALGTTVALDAGCSQHVSFQASYQWELGDGRTATGSRVQVQYAQAGNYMVRLAIEDRGIQATAQKPLRAVAAAERPNACFVWERSPFSPHTPACTVAFDASCSTGNIVEYRWFFAGGPPVEGRFPDATRITNSPETEYSWALDMECLYFRPFERLVRLRVTDADGNTDTHEEVVEFLFEFLRPS